MPSHYGSPHNPMVVGTHGLAVQTLLRSVVLAGLGSLAVAPLVGVPRPADAAPVRHSGGIGTATASVVNFSEAARSPDAKTPVPVDPRIDEFHRRARPALPSRPTSGSRRVPPVAAAPHLAPIVSSNFDGISQMGPCGGCGVPPDPKPPPAAPRSSSWSIHSSRSQTPTAPSSVAAA